MVVKRTSSGIEIRGERAIYPGKERASPDFAREVRTKTVLRIEED